MTLPALYDPAPRKPRSPARIACRALLLGLAAAPVGMTGAATPQASPPSLQPLQQSEQACRALARLKIDTVAITAADHVVSAGAATGYCEVRATVGRSHDVIVRLPDNWKQRYVQFGGGGFDGFIPSAAAPSSPVVASGHDLASDGYIVAVSNGGHRREEFPDASFSTDRSLTLSYASAKILDTDLVGYGLAQAYYGERPKFRYFAGCSNGGKNASVAAAHFSQRFDGIIGGDGLWGVARDYAGGGDAVGYSLKWVDTFQAGPTLSAAKGARIYAEQLLQCDGLDGLKDGIIADPRACARRLDLTRISCAKGESKDCLTEGDLALVARRRAPLMREGRTVGAAWGIDNPAGAGGPEIAEGFLAMSTGSSARPDLSRVDTATAYDQLQASLDGVYHMTGDVDGVKRYLAGGGKLMIFHGWEDTGVPPEGSVGFYNELVGSGGAAASNARLYMVPGMPHCRGGNGADSADLLAAMARWVEQGKAPESTRLTAWKAPEGTRPDDYDGRNIAKSRFSRPLCAYPLVPKYRGGPSNEAASFSCVKS